MLPPPDVRKKLGASSLIMGIDIETHDWEERSRGNQRSLGQFGFYSLCHPDDFNARVVQLGWAIGGYGGTPSVKEKIVRPEGFVISVKAAKYHGITQENATTQGCDLKGVWTSSSTICSTCSDGEDASWFTTLNSIVEL